MMNGGNRPLLPLLPALLVVACWAGGCRRAEPEPAVARSADAPADLAASPATSAAAATPDSPLDPLTDAAALVEDDAPRLAPVTEREPQTDAAREVVELLRAIEQNLVETRYQHRIVVSERRGKYFWDCSGMVAWVLERAAPCAREALPDDQPLARDFYDRIADSPTDEPHRGWLRLAGPARVAPGDLFAWRKPDFWAERPNTGHVGFVLSTPQPHPDHADVWVMRVADATKMLHEDDSRPPDGEGGFGTATMAFRFDETGTPVAYGWYGAGQPPDTFVPTTIAFGRVSG
ncbi:MAG: hypothetical protein JXB32_13810 [Deltaproteobacteria bacterium]|nr:hypothetical protein [Deltaproteobacteria bacterium]